MWFGLAFLGANLAVFNLYGFHLDLVMLEMFFFDFKGLGLPMPLLVLAALALLALGFLVWLVFKASQAEVRFKPKLNVATLAAFGLGWSFMLLSQSIHAWAMVYQQTSITRYTTLFPIFFPVESQESVHRVVGWFPGLKPEQASSEQDPSLLGKAAVVRGDIYYPRAPMQCSNEQPKSIVLIILESWQADTLNAAVMPQISSLSGKSLFFRQHVSSGSVTIGGLFGLMYGLHPSYYGPFRAQASKVPALLTSVAVEQGYELRVFSSGDFERFSLRSLFFPMIKEEHLQYFPNDRLLTDRVREVVAGRSRGDASFDVIFFTSPHSPYRYPASHKRFEPVAPVKGAYALNKSIDPLPFRNDYRNSLAYVDDLVGEVVAALKRSGRFDDTWLVITGDHGEEFNESGLGLWGHGSSFSKWQTATPLVLKVPNSTQSGVVEGPTFHQDVAPTLLRHALGCSNPLKDYSNGVSLLSELPASRHAVIASYVSHAYWIDGVISERNTGRRYLWGNPSEAALMRPDASRLRTIFEEESMFLRP
jgi:membrane-anchored protein YejM (alkaline phosphatase superfamily)